MLLIKACGIWCESENYGGQFEFVNCFIKLSGQPVIPLVSQYRYRLIGFSLNDVGPPVILT